MDKSIALSGTKKKATIAGGFCLKTGNKKS